MRENFIIKWSFLRLLLIIAVVLFLYSFTNNRNEKRALTEVDVIFSDKDAKFLSKADVLDFVRENVGEITHLKRSDIDLYKLETDLNNHGLVKRAEIYMTINGLLMLEVNQKRAIGRVYAQNNSFYIDEEGKYMPLSKNFSAHVPLVFGNVNKENLSGIFEVLYDIDKDEFLKKDITEMYLNSDNTLVLRGRKNNYDIAFDTMTEISKKLYNYKVFKQYAILNNINDTYKKINLKFTKQVVCTKND